MSSKLNDAVQCISRYIASNLPDGYSLQITFDCEGVSLAVHDPDGEEVVPNADLHDESFIEDACIVANVDFSDWACDCDE